MYLLTNMNDYAKLEINLLILEDVVSVKTVFTSKLIN